MSVESLSVPRPVLVFQHQGGIFFVLIESKSTSLTIDDVISSLLWIQLVGIAVLYASDLICLN